MEMGQKNAPLVRVRVSPVFESVNLSVKLGNHQLPSTLFIICQSIPDVSKKLPPGCVWAYRLSLLFDMELD